MDYVVLFVSVTVMSVFLSVHYLTLYYLLQPYNVDTEMRSGTYRVMTAVTYAVCYLMMWVRLPALLWRGTHCLLRMLLHRGERPRLSTGAKDLSHPPVRPHGREDAERPRQKRQFDVARRSLAV